MTEFKTGDKVKLTDAHAEIYPDLKGETLTVVSNETKMIIVTRPNGLEHGFYPERLRFARIEGEEIGFEDIRIGDEIRSELKSDDLFVTRQGVVATIGSEFGSNSLWTGKHKRIDVDPKRETYILVKSAPEPDKVMEKLKESPEGTIVQLPNSKKTLCRKEIRNDGNKWICYFPGGQDTMAEKTFSALIRNDFDKLVWIA
jgi:hypothetical protein